ncbi:MAG: class I SAM-dependent methyltransferase [Muriicola sp.]|nr:class I SAM-dependent methyltransferase [Muriicola sp.]NNK12225.1 class I SAM-dependent methyltransferase [Flavobacteriaceae bacterium]
MKYVFCSILLIFVFANYTGYSQVKNAETGYTFRSGDPNGIGKWYMGREIAYVMGYQGINWLERPEREKEEQTSLLIKNMDINPGDRIADIGAGSGYHVFKMAPKTKDGIVYAVDIQDGMLSALRARKNEQQVTNVEVVKGSERSINLPKNSVDKVLMVDVYHEFAYPKEMMASVVKALRAEGKLFLIEYRGEDRSVPIKKVHKMTVAQAVKEMEAIGMKLEKNMGNLPWQHCMIFVKK